MKKLITSTLTKTDIIMFFILLFILSGIMLITRKTDVSTHHIFIIWVVIFSTFYLLSCIISNIQENFKIINKRFFENEKDIDFEKLSESEKLKIKVENFIKYIMTTKRIKEVKKDGKFNIVMFFTDKSSLNIWISNKYYAFASNGKYKGTNNNKIIWNTYISPSLAEEFDNWIQNQIKIQIYENEDIEYGKTLEPDYEDESKKYVNNLH